MGQFWDVIGQRHDIHYKRDGLAYPKLINVAEETDPLKGYTTTFCVNRFSGLF